MNMWMVFAALIVLALMFLLWPWSKLRAEKKAQLQEDQNQQALNVQLYQERLKELTLQLQADELSQTDFDSLSAEAARTLLADSDSAEVVQQGLSKTAWPLLAIVLVLPIASIVWYQSMGANADMAITQLIEAKYTEHQTAMSEARRPSPEVTVNLINALEARLESVPENTSYWYLLARENMQLGQYDKAVVAYREILTRESQTGQQAPEILAQLAQAEFLAAGNQLNPGIMTLVERSLEQDPENTTALGLAGIHAFEQKNFSDAIKHWQKAVEIMGVRSPGAQALQAGISRARQMLAVEGAPVDQGEGVESELTLDKRVTVKVALTEEVKAQALVEGDLPVFIYARAHPDGRMPLAIRRVFVSDLPLTITLTDEMAMAPGATISTAQQIELVARVSKQGTPKAVAGDWQQTSDAIAVAGLDSKGEKVYSLLIDTQL